MINAKTMAAAALLAVGGLRAACYAQDWKELSGDFSGIARETAVVVRNQSDWEALWRQHERRWETGPGIPSVDFAREWVVGVFMGSVPQAGRAVDIEIVDPGQPAPLGVKYRWVLPGDDEFAAEVLTEPFKLLKVRSGYARVDFERLPSKKRASRKLLGFGYTCVRSCDDECGGGPEGGWCYNDPASCPPHWPNRCDQGRRSRAKIEGIIKERP